MSSDLDKYRETLADFREAVSRPDITPEERRSWENVCEHLERQIKRIEGGLIYQFRLFMSRITSRNIAACITKITRRINRSPFSDNYLKNEKKRLEKI